MNDGLDVRSCKGDVRSRQINVEKKQNCMLKRCESVGGSKKSEIQMGEREHGGNSPEKDVIELCGSAKHQH